MPAKKPHHSFTIDPTHKAFILESFDLVTIASNEAERSAALIADVVKAVVLALRKAGIHANFRARHIYSEEGKREFITDFELYDAEVLFHIVEAKGATGLSGAIDQIHEQLRKTSCLHGCITDGFSWQFVHLGADKLELVGGPLAVKTELDLIFDGIFASLPAGEIANRNGRILSSPKR